MTPNLYGNLVTNIVAGLCGGPGVSPGANVGSAVCIFEQGARHVAKDIVGKVGTPGLFLGPLLEQVVPWDRQPTRLRANSVEQNAGCHYTPLTLVAHVQGIANPIALLLSTSMMLRHLSLHAFADRCRLGCAAALQAEMQRVHVPACGRTMP